MCCAAWGHDLVEDTDTKVRELRELFGDTVAALIEAVTSESGVDRRARVALTLPKTRAAGPFAVRLKLADRIANVSCGGASFGSYKKEYPQFRQALRGPAWENDDMWWHLDEIMGFTDRPVGQVPRELSKDPMLPVLDVTDFDKSGYRLTWYFPDIDDYGACLGETSFTQKDLTAALEADDGTTDKVGDRLHVLANLTVQQMKPKVSKDSSGFTWESESAARRALKIVNTALEGGKSWPQWAIAAKDAGWKPPEGLEALNGPSRWVPHVVGSLHMRVTQDLVDLVAWLSHERGPIPLAKISAAFDGRRYAGWAAARMKSLEQNGFCIRTEGALSTRAVYTLDPDALDVLVDLQRESVAKALRVVKGCPGANPSVEDRVLRLMDDDIIRHSRDVVHELGVSSSAACVALLSLTRQGLLNRRQDGGTIDGNAAVGSRLQYWRKR